MVLALLLTAISALPSCVKSKESKILAILLVHCRKIGLAVAFTALLALTMGLIVTCKLRITVEA
jgi:hypothetical protein